MRNVSSAVKNNNVKSQMNSEDSFGFLKWVIKTEITIALVFFIIICTYKLIPQKIVFEIKHYINRNFINSNEKHIVLSNVDNEKKYDTLICDSLKKNKNLNNEEKEFINKYLKDEICENLNYIDTKKISKRLENLKINYNKKYFYDEKEEEYKSNNLEFEVLGIVGIYNAFFNEINLYEQIEEYEIFSNYGEKDFGFNECNKEALFHELNHLLAKNSFNTITNKSIFSETINELFTKEYYYSIDYAENIGEKIAYDEFMMYAYGLAEILPDEVIKKYKFDNNESILIDGLLDIDNNIEKAYDLISSVNSLNILEKEKSNDSYQNYQKIHDSYKYFYEKKYNEKMENNIDFLLYFYNTPIQTREERKVVENYLKDNYDNGNKIESIIPKGYFSEKYKNSHEIIKIY